MNAVGITLLPNANTTLTKPPGTRRPAPPTKTYRVGWADGTAAVGGTVDGPEALRQAIFKYLQTWRGRYPIYNRQYGIELHDLPGMERGYVRAVVRERIRDALSIDERILDVTDFVFEETERDAVSVTFNVRTVYGDIAQRWEVPG